jgi:Fic family protein
MTLKAHANGLDLNATQVVTRGASSLLSRKIWLPRLVYDALPYFYMTAAFAAFFATLYISDWFWVLPHYFLFSAAIFHLAFAVIHKRSRETDSDQLDKT